MEDRQIVELYLERSEKAIEATEKAYGRYLSSIAFGILQNTEDAEETVNDTYLKAWSSIPPAEPSPLKAFLGRITRTLSINKLEALTAQKRGGGQYAQLTDELLECLPDSSENTIEDSVLVTDLLDRFLRSLPPRQRRVFIRRYWFMDSTADIAKAFSMSEGAVRSMLMRTRERLKEQLIKEGLFL